MKPAAANLLERAGKAVLVVSDDGVVRWGNRLAHEIVPALARQGIRIEGFRSGQALDIAEGRLECEAVDEGWALFLEPMVEVFPSGRVLDLIPVPIFWKDRAGIYRGCNLAFADFLGTSSAEIVGKGVFELSPPELAEKYYAMDESLMSSGPEAVQRYQWEVRRADGGVRHVLFHKANIDDGDGRVIGLVGMVQDITDLQRLERKFTTVFSACPDAIAITDKATGRYIDVNPAFEESLGFARAEVLGHTSLELGIWLDADERAGMLAALGERGRLGNFETRFRRKDGSLFTALISVEATELDGAQCLIMVGHDISDRKREEVLLRQTADELLRSNAELERFAYVAAHDLQEPCRTICSFAQLLERRFGGVLGEDGREYLSYLSSGAQRMRDLIQGLLMYSRVDNAAQRLDPQDLGLLVDSALKDLAAVVEQTGAHISVGSLPWVRGDAVQLRLVFANLIGNALKFQPPGQTPEVEIAARQDGATWLVSVKDNGIGIAPEYTGEVFGMFRRLHSGDSYPGTGIGLALVKRVVEAHGGRVWVDSRPGEGTTFWLALPG